MNEEVKSENLRIHSRADELIACLEGEIAKRDEELAACRIAVENCDLFLARIAELEFELEVAKTDELSAAVWAATETIKHDLWDAQAELAALKAQCVVMPERLKPSRYEIQDARADAWNSCLDEVARLNATPVQQVSVPAWMASSRAFADRLYMAGWRDYADAQHSGVAGMYDELLSAAPAADAPSVEMVQAACAAFRMDISPMLAMHYALCAALAAHRAKGVV